jgi:iron(III) transport system permease protein
VPGYLTPFVGAVAWITLLSPNVGYLNGALRYFGLPTLDIYSYGGIIWVMGLYFAPVAYLFILPALGSVDRSLEESARVMGATPLQVLRKIVVPLIAPALLSSTLVIFVMALGDFGIPGVLGSRDRIEVIPQPLALQPISVSSPVGIMRLSADVGCEPKPPQARLPASWALSSLSCIWC